MCSNDRVTVKRPPVCDAIHETGCDLLVLSRRNPPDSVCLIFIFISLEGNMCSSVFCETRLSLADTARALVSPCGSILKDKKAPDEKQL